jgi:hypothetical protein
MKNHYEQPCLYINKMHGFGFLAHNNNNKHFLLECHDFSQARNRFYSVNSLKEIFNTIPSKNIIDYLKEINLYSRV